LKRWQWLAGGGVLLLLIIVFSLRSTSPKGEVVYTEPVKRRSIESVVSAPGEVDPRVKVNISANVIGKIDRLHFKEGDLVVERAADEINRKITHSAPEAGNDADKVKKKYALVAEGKKVRLREVTTGISDTTHVVIASGLKEGESIGPFCSLKKLRAGDPVEPQREGANAEKEQKDKDES
jgi:multidrug efflux pump subunit AcrA (membrane-fusion protein)